MAMQISSLDLERHCRIHCRPIHTGLGQVTVRPIRRAGAGVRDRPVGHIALFSLLPGTEVLVGGHAASPASTTGT